MSFEFERGNDIWKETTQRQRDDDMILQKNHKIYSAKKNKKKCHTAC